MYETRSALLSRKQSTCHLSNDALTCNLAARRSPAQRTRPLVRMDAWVYFGQGGQEYWWWWWGWEWRLGRWGQWWQVSRRVGDWEWTPVGARAFDGEGRAGGYWEGWRWRPAGHRWR